MPGNNSSAISIAVSQRPFEQLRQVQLNSWSRERLQTLTCVCESECWREALNPEEQGPSQMHSLPGLGVEDRVLFSIPLGARSQAWLHTLIRINAGP